jgi:AcrR family transcriptional regulator
MLPRFARLDLERPSLRQLAVAAAVTAPTLQHYFGDRAGAVAALLEEYDRLSEARLKRMAEPRGPFAESMRAFAQDFVAALQARGPVRLGDMLAASLCEGLADPLVSPHALREIIDPAVDALAGRLQRHMAAGEMREGDVRTASLMLVSPLLLAVLHQDQMNGRAIRPLALEPTAEAMAAAFVRAFANPGV